MLEGFSFFLLFGGVMGRYGGELVDVCNVSEAGGGLMVYALHEVMLGLVLKYTGGRWCLKACLGRR